MESSIQSFTLWFGWKEYFLPIKCTNFQCSKAFASAVITIEMKRKWLTKTARTQGHSIEFFRDPFKLVPTTQLADLADRFTRNEILSSNEFRAIIGYKPSSEPRADELVNKNIANNGEAGTTVGGADEVNSVLEQLQNDIDRILSGEETGDNDAE